LDGISPLPAVFVTLELILADPPVDLVLVKEWTDNGIVNTRGVIWCWMCELVDSDVLQQTQQKNIRPIQ
jgi:hypothetical protein